MVIWLSQLRKSKSEADARLESLRAKLGDRLVEKVLLPRTKIVGMNYPNPDGSDRHQIASALQKGSPVLLLREPNNAYDRNAIAVCLMRGDDDIVQIGYLPKEEASICANAIAEGLPIRGEVEWVGDRVLSIDILHTALKPKSHSARSSK